MAAPPKPAPSGGTYGQGSDNFASLACGLTNLVFCPASYGGIYGQSNLGKHVSVEYQPRSPTARATMAASCSCPSTDGLSNCGYCTLRIFLLGHSQAHPELRRARLRPRSTTTAPRSSTA